MHWELLLPTARDHVWTYEGTTGPMVLADTISDSAPNPASQPDCFARDRTISKVKAKLVQRKQKRLTSITGEPSASALPNHLLSCSRMILCVIHAHPSIPNHQAAIALNQIPNLHPVKPGEGHFQ